MTLEQRIEMMEATGVISPATTQKLAHLRGLFAERFGIRLTEENAAGCITHFALALERLARGETVEPASDLVMEELRRHPDFETACYLTDHILDQVAPLPEPERRYVLLHVITVLTRVREEYDRQVREDHQS